MEVIAEKSWGWMLFADGERLLLSVVCGGVGVYEVVFELMADEVVLFERTGSTYLEELAGAVRSMPAAFEARRLSNVLTGAEATNAVAAWRERRPLG